MGKLAILAVMALYPLALSASHHTVTMKDGTRYYGEFIDASSRTITFQDENGTRRRLDIRDVQTLDFGSGTDSAFSQSSDRDRSIDADRRRTSDRDRYSNRDSNRDRNYSSSASLDARELPTGTEISVRTNETIDSKSAAEGRTYSAQVDKDVVDRSGSVVIPRGSEAQLVIRNFSGGGTAGSPDLVLDLQSVLVGGRRYLISTEDMKQSNREGIGKNRRTAEMVGGGAALGTLLGAIAGGGKGALIGAIAGAAAGGTAQVLTKGKEVKVPAETVLNFRMDQPVRLESVR